MRTLTREQYLPYAPRKNGKKRNKSKTKRKQSEQHVKTKRTKKRQTRTATVHFCAFLFALPFAALFCFLFALFNYFGSLYLWLARPTQE